MREKLPQPEQNVRGKLTVFLGAAAGVGKTYTMLEAACDQLQAGTDVVSGWMETHGQADVTALLAKLPNIPPLMLEIHGQQLPEMDVSSILARKPALVLVDELAHANVEGTRHARRFQDVIEILDAGIDVYSTLNIQQIESLKDVVEQITGTVVQDALPDWILEQADTVQLVDITPEELIKRLNAGKVHILGEAEESRHFFRPGNINALRELALRFTAKRVDQELTGYMRNHQIDGSWPTTGRIMVCVSASPFSAQLVRSASRLAAGLQTEWLAVHVEGTRNNPPGKAAKEQVVTNLRLAADLGARIFNVSGESVAEEILALARLHNVASIVVGKPRRNQLRELIHSSVVSELVRQSGNINIYIIQTGDEPKPATGSKPRRSLPDHSWRHYGGSLLMVAVITVLGWSLQFRLELVNIALLYQLPVIFSAFWWGRWPSYFAAACSVLSLDFLFVPPFFTLSVEDIRYLWSFFTFLIVAFFIGRRTELLRNEANAARQREKNIHALFDFSKEIAAAIDKIAIAGKLSRQAAEALNRPVTVLLPDAKGELKVWMQAEPGMDRQPADKKSINRVLAEDKGEIAVARWSYEHRRAAGHSTETMAGAKYLYIPLTTRDSAVGVIGIWVAKGLITPEQRQSMDAWAGLAAIAIERVELTEKAKQAGILLESDRLRSALFNSISHELRTPLSSIVGSASTLAESENVYSEAERKELLDNIRDGATRMERLVANLLDTARLESGMMKLKQDWCDIEDVVGTALHRLAEQVKNRPVDIEIPDNLPMLQGDFVLLEQVIINLVDNAMKYSPSGSRIKIEAGLIENFIQVSVSDKGIGIPEEELEHVFDKFFRVQHVSDTPGTGLGLSICRGIVEAHGGKIRAANLPGGGLKVAFVLPIGSSTDDKELRKREVGYDR